MEEDYISHFRRMQQKQFELRSSTYKQRIAKLKKLKSVLEQNEANIFEALHADLNKNQHEAAVTELYFIYAEIRYAMKHLKGWMKRQSKRTSFTNLFSSNWTIYEPKGLSLIISPWNYPIQLSLSPILSAIAAGCAFVLKPSEYSPNTSTLLQNIVTAVMDPDEGVCYTGEKEVATALLDLPFENIFFTGSPQIGRVIMAAASKNLAAVTLELGGKSPAILDNGYDIKDAATKLAWGKLINAGQTCIAPDYLLLQSNQLSDFVSAFENAVRKLFYTEKQEMNDDLYTKIINEKHLERLHNLEKEAISKGSKVLWKASLSDITKFTPTLIQVEATVVDNIKLMKEEIFGPILPIICYEELSDAIRIMQALPKPLSMYIFTKDTNTSDFIMQHCSSGSVCINDVLIQVSNPNLPFGGINNSGLGACHGFYGFKAFSHERSILKQSRISSTKLIYPPYDKKKSIFTFLKNWM